MMLNQDWVNALWLVGLFAFLWLLFRRELAGLWGRLLGRPVGAEPEAVVSRLTEAEEAELSRRIGAAVGAMGGTMEDAAVARYAILRASKGAMPTDDQIARGVGMTLGAKNSSGGEAGGE